VLLESVNFHLYKPCNEHCVFCFATFRDVEGQLPLDDVRRVVGELRNAGVGKINFAGGEPTLYRGIGAVIEHAKTLGLTTSIVTNGARLVRLLEGHAGALDWVGLSADSSVESVQHGLGRGRGDHVARTIAHADLARRAGVRVKLNTVVTAATWREDMSAFVGRVAPERWKVFQVLPMRGQNDGRVEPLLITSEQFATFVGRHQPLAASGMAPIVEDNDAMRGSYAMIDPLGRFFGNATGEHVYSEPILEVGVAAALSQVGFSKEKFEERGGSYAW
jgi:radical S-adenosyl methionine domain-containing protein 2